MNEMKMSRRGEEPSVPAGIRIREAAVDDAARLLEIYSYYVEKTAITFEYDVPSLEEFRGRIAHIKERYPYLVIERSGVIEGYAYAGVFKDRAAYDRSCEMTIYLDREAVGGGLGRKLYETLEEALRAQGTSISTPVSDILMKRTNIWTTTARSFTNIWDTERLEPSTSADTSSDGGTA